MSEEKLEGLASSISVGKSENQQDSRPNRFSDAQEFGFEDFAKQKDADTRQVQRILKELQLEGEKKTVIGGDIYPSFDEQVDLYAEAERARRERYGQQPEEIAEKDLESKIREVTDSFKDLVEGSINYPHANARYTDGSKFNFNDQTKEWEDNDYRFEVAYTYGASDTGTKRIDSFKMMPLNPKDRRHSKLHVKFQDGEVAAIQLEGPDVQQLQVAQRYASERFSSIKRSIDLGKKTVKFEGEDKYFTAKYDSENNTFKSRNDEISALGYVDLVKDALGRVPARTTDRS